MAKELPYFKFEPAEYLTKNISFCSLSAQGLFINICSYYWQRNCILTKDQVLKRLNYKQEIDELISEGIIDLQGEFITIKFLDNQLVEVDKTSKQNSANGAKGGRPKKPTESENKPTALFSLSETKGIREEKRIIDNNTYVPKLAVSVDKDLFKIDFNKLIIHFNEITGKKTRTIPKKAKDQFIKRLKEGYSKEDISTAINNCYNSDFHKTNGHKNLTLEFISREDKFAFYYDFKETKQNLKKQERL